LHVTCSKESREEGQQPTPSTSGSEATDS